MCETFSIYSDLAVVSLFSSSFFSPSPHLLSLSLCVYLCLSLCILIFISSFIASEMATHAIACQYCFCSRASIRCFRIQRSHAHSPDRCMCSCPVYVYICAREWVTLFCINMKALYDGQSEYVCLTRYYHWRGMRAKTLAHCRPHLKYYVPSFVCMRMRLSFFQYIFYCSFIYLAFFNIYIYMCVCVMWFNTLKTIIDG